MNLAAKPGRNDANSMLRNMPSTDNIGPEPDLLQTLKVLRVNGTRASFVTAS